MSEADSTTPATGTFKPKKSVALSGVTAGNTALCTVGRTGNDLHYRGYDILELARACEFEEIAYLLVHEKLPTQAELTAYKTKLKSLRGLPANVKLALECDAGFRTSDGRDAHRRVGARHGAAREGRPQHAGREGYRRPPDGLARFDAALLVSLFAQRPAHRSRNRRRFDRRTLPASAARRGAVEVVGRRDARVAEPVRGARVQRFDVHRPRDRGHGFGHLFGDHRRDRRAARAEARRRQRSRVRDPVALSDARRSGSRHQAARREQGSRDRLRPSGVHDLRPAQRGDQGSGEEAVAGSRRT